MTDVNERVAPKVFDSFDHKNFDEVIHFREHRPNETARMPIPNFISDEHKDIGNLINRFPEDPSKENLLTLPNGVRLTTLGEIIPLGGDFTVSQMLT